MIWLRIVIIEEPLNVAFIFMYSYKVLLDMYRPTEFCSEAYISRLEGFKEPENMNKYIKMLYVL